MSESRHITCQLRNSENFALKLSRGNEKSDENYWKLNWFLGFLRTDLLISNGILQPSLWPSWRRCLIPEVPFPFHCLSTCSSSRTERAGTVLLSFPWRISVVEIEVRWVPVMAVTVPRFDTRSRVTVSASAVQFTRM